MVNTLSMNHNKLLDFYVSSPLGKKLIIRVIMFSSFLTLLFTGGQLFWEFNSDIKKIEFIENQIDKSFLKSIETAVWAINEQQVKAMLEGVVALPSITKASIINDDGFSFSTDNEKIPSNRIITRVLRPPANIPSHSNIGILEIEQTTSEAYTNLKKRLATVLFFNFIKTFFVATFLMFLFHKLVTKHLLEINSFMGNATRENVTEKLIIARPSNHLKDEIDFFVDSFNSMRAKLHLSWVDLENSEKRFRRLVKGSLQGILIVDGDWKFLYANNKCFNHLGFSKKKAESPNVRNIFPKEIIENVSTFFNSNEKTTIYSDEITLSFANHVERLVQAVFIQTTHDGVPAIQIVMFDITNLKELKQKQKDYEIQLIHNNKMTAVGTMLSGVTHEINNPNHMIKQNSLILKETWQALEPLLEKQASTTPNTQYNNLLLSDILKIIPDLIADIRHGSDNINTIIDDLKLFVRQDQSQDVEEVDINSTLKDVIHLLRISIERSCRNFQFSLDDGLPTVWGYRQRLSQVFINLIVNALESLKSPTDKILISTFSQDDKVYICFSDEGMGIDKDCEDKIFDAFFSTKTNTGGTGLGLSISQSIIQQHHGKITINSETNKGAEFLVELPIDKKPTNIPLGLK